MKRFVRDFRITSEYSPAAKETLVACLLAGEKNGGGTLQSDQVNSIVSAHKNRASIAEIFDELMDLEIVFSTSETKARTRLVGDYEIRIGDVGQAVNFKLSNAVAQLINTSHDASVQFLTHVLLWKKSRYAIPLYNYLLDLLDPQENFQIFFVNSSELGNAMAGDRVFEKLPAFDCVKFYYNGLRKAFHAINRFANFFVDSLPVYERAKSKNAESKLLGLHFLIHQKPWLVPSYKGPKFFSQKALSYAVQQYPTDLQFFDPKFANRNGSKTVRISASGNEKIHPKNVMEQIEKIALLMLKEFDSDSGNNFLVNCHVIAAKSGLKYGQLLLRNHLK